MKFALAWLTLAPLVVGQPLVNATLNDLQQRTTAALTSLRGRPPLSPQDVRTRLEESLRLDRLPITDDAEAQLYQPPQAAPLPAVVIIKPHSDKSKVTQEAFPATLARFGFLTIVVDTFPDHANLDRLLAGATPETLIQAHVRGALQYLLSRPDVDPKRIALVADTLAGTIAANLNPEFSAIVLTHAAPDLGEALATTRSLGPSELPDACLLVPGLLQYSDSTMLLSAIAPRPLLLFESRRAVYEIVRDAYSTHSAGAQLRIRDESVESETQMEIIRWLQSQLINYTAADVADTSHPANVIRGRIAPPPAQPPTPVTPPIADLLGAPLPMDPLNLVLQCATPSQRTTTTTQLGFEIPMTVLRPGPLGCGQQDGIIVAFADAGRASLENDPFLLEAVRRNWMVWIVDPRGIGELKSPADAFLFTSSVLLGENFARRQAADLARIVENASRMLPNRTGIYAQGKLASLLAGYALNIAGHERLTWMIVRDGPLSNDDFSALPIHAIPIASQGVFTPADLFRSMPANSLFFGAPPQDLNWR